MEHERSGWPVEMALYRQLIIESERLYHAVKAELAAHPSDSMEGVELIQSLLTERDELLLAIIRMERERELEQGEETERQRYLHQLLDWHRQTEPLIQELYSRVKKETQQFQQNKVRHRKLQRMAEGYQTDGYLFDERK